VAVRNSPGNSSKPKKKRGQPVAAKKLVRRKAVQKQVDRKPECMVIMPFGGVDTKFPSLTIYTNVIEPLIQRALGKDANYYRIDTKDVQKPIKNEILEGLMRADVVVADISENNPNVMFELGFRIAQEKPFVLITNDSEQIRFWSRTYQINDYSKSAELNRIVKRIQAAYDSSKNQSKTEDELHRLLQRIRGDEEKFANPFQDRIAAWRIERALEQITSIQQKNWGLDAKQPPAYIAFIFEGVMELLERNEEYCTLSNLNFWSQNGVGDSSFLQENVKAVCRGAIIKRVILIDRKSWDSKAERDELLPSLQKHEDAILELKKGLRGKMIVKCLVTDQYEKFLNDDHHHFGMLRHMTGRNKDDGRVLILPRYGRNGAISGLNFIFSGKSRKHNITTEEYLDVFERVFRHRDTLDLREFLQQTKRRKS
jgi:nucleoside 2-deoxyribosyltransferase